MSGGSIFVVLWGVFEATGVARWWRGWTYKRAVQIGWLALLLVTGVMVFAFGW